MFEKKVEINENELKVLLKYLGFNPEKEIFEITDSTKQKEGFSTILRKFLYWVNPEKEGVVFNVEIQAETYHSVVESNGKSRVSVKYTRKIRYKKKIPFQ